MGLLQRLLQLFALLLLVTQRGTQRGIARLGGADPVSEFDDARVELAQLLLAGQDATMGVILARHAQPVGTEPETVTGDHRLVRREAAAQGQRPFQVLGGVDAGEQRRDARPVDQLAAQQLGRSAQRCRGHARVDQEQVPSLEPGRGRGMVREVGDADRLERRSEHGLERVLPARFRAQPLCQAWCIGQPGVLEPGHGAGVGLAQRRLLQRFERGLAAPGALQLVTQPVELLAHRQAVVAQRLDALAQGGVLLFALLDLGLARVALGGELGDLVDQRLGIQACQLLVEPIAALAQPLATLLELVGARAFDLGLLGRLGRCRVEALPLRLPRLHRLFRGAARIVGRLLALA
jgi:hypothetical protein